ncbi:MAG: DUF3352 domain-containing protein [Thermoleophilaceae bacterium]|nr:DUF3352 domain-containing protein [Thermoleophilaceae bacterium]
MSTRHGFRRQVVGFAITGAALVLAGCGQAGSGDDPPSSLAPAAASVYVEATVDPAGDQETALRALYAKFPGGAEAEPGAFISNLIETGLQQSGAPIDFAADIEPWLGERAGVFLTNVAAEEPDGALVLSTDDAEAAATGLEKVIPGGSERTYEGAEYRLAPPQAGPPVAVGLVDGFVVVGTEAGLKAAVDAEDASLADSDRYTQPFEELPADGLVSLFADVRSLVEASLAEQGLPPAAQNDALAQLDDQPPLAAVLSADTGGLVLDGPSVAATGGELAPVSSPELLGSLPSNSLIAVGAPEIGMTINEAVSESVASSGLDIETLGSIVESQVGFNPFEATAWMGDLAIFAGGTTIDSADGALVIETTDPEASATTIRQLEELIRKEIGGEARIGAPPIDGDAGFSVSDPELPKALVLVQRDAKVVIAYGETAAKRALEPQSVLSDDAAYKSAVASLGTDYAPTTYVAIRPLFEALGELIPSGSDPAAVIATSYIEPLLNLISGNRPIDDQALSRTRLNVE